MRAMDPEMGREVVGKGSQAGLEEDGRVDEVAGGARVDQRKGRDGNINDKNVYSLVLINSCNSCSLSVSFPILFRHSSLVPFPFIFLSPFNPLRPIPPLVLFFSIPYPH